MAVSDNAVKAAQKAYRECEGDSTESHRAALTAALPFLPVQVAVKKLEWNEYEDEQGIPDRWDAEASSFGVFYSIEIQHDGYRVVFDHEAVGAVGLFDTLEAAKAAAQADYEARILSALEPSAGRAAVIEEGYRQGIEAAAQIAERPVIAFSDGAVEASRRIASSIRALSSPDHADAGKVEGDGWRPIESAPKDGRFVDLWHVSQGRVPDCRWFTNNQKFTGWHAQQGGRAYNMGGDKMFTHWRQLPSAPSEGVE